MEDRKDEFVLILAGYTNEMEFFLQSNPGLMPLPLYILIFLITIAVKALAIAELMLERRQYRLTEQARQISTFNSKGTSNGAYNFGNARTVRNWIELAIRRQAVRL